MTPRLLDLFSGAGGAGAGYARAGFDVTGVDIKPMPRYPFTFIQADALEYVAEHGHEYDVIHASPPCQRYSRATVQQRQAGIEYPDLLAATRAALRRVGVPWVIENVALAPIQSGVMLCGQMFGLRLLRHRLFESSTLLLAPPHPSHVGLVRGVQADFVCAVTNAWKKGVHHDDTAPVWREALGIDWMTKREMSEAIPPAYTEYIGRLILSQMEIAA